MAVDISFRNKKNKLHQIQSVLPLLLFLGDILGLAFSLTLVLWLRLGQQLNWFDPLIYIFVPLVLLGLYLADAYYPDTQIAGLRTPFRILICNVIVSAIAAALFYLTGVWGKNPLAGRLILLPSLGIFTIWAVMLRLWVVKWVRSHAQHSRWLMLGAGEKAIKFAQTFLKLNSLGRLLFLTEDNQDPNLLVESRLDCLGNLTDLPTWSQQPWSGVVVATQIDLSDVQVRQLMEMRLQGIPIYRIPDICETLWYKLPPSLLQDSWLAFGAGFHLAASGINLKLKRLTDIVLAGLLLLCLFPLMLLVALVIKLDSPGSVFYTQVRTGLEGQPFRVYKFRSMYQDAEKRGVQWAREGDSRITKVGRWLRLTRIDELPQILNVLQGQMSLIGPRPERPEFDVNLRQDIPYYDLRYLVKPGITGWAQVMYPYGASVEDAYEKLAYDLYYIKNYSFWLDLAIALKTVRVVLLGKGR
ncbi:MAG: sugar transferase [Stigonema ocellatum SAG 48.90 = DSM 106950]|nr:sugar transferase [Stigonema ocellatum SAG 48.90 = DSM 106950]